MIFGKPVINIQKIDENEELIALFGYGNDTNEILVTNKRIYRNTKDEFVVNEFIIGLDAVRYTSMRYRHKIRQSTPWVGIILLVLAAILTTIAIAISPHVVSQGIRDYLFPILFTAVGAIAVCGVVIIIKKISGNGMPHEMPKGVIYIYLDGEKPFRILIFENDIQKIREAHAKINMAIDKAKNGKKI